MLRLATTSISMAELGCSHAGFSLYQDVTLAAKARAPKHRSGGLETAFNYHMGRENAGERTTSPLDCSGKRMAMRYERLVAGAEPALAS